MSRTCMKCWICSARMEWLSQYPSVTLLEINLSISAIYKCIIDHPLLLRLLMQSRLWSSRQIAQKKIIIRCNYFVQKIQEWNFKLARPLNNYLQKDTELNWLGPSTEALDAFYMLKSNLVNISFADPSAVAQTVYDRHRCICNALGAVFLQQKSPEMGTTELWSANEDGRSIRRKKLLGNKTRVPWGCMG